MIAFETSRAFMCRDGRVQYKLEKTLLHIFLFFWIEGTGVTAD